MANVNRMTLASLSKRGITMTEHELHIAVLYGMVRGACFAFSRGEASMEESSAHIDEAVQKFHNLENPSSEDVVL